MFLNLIMILQNPPVFFCSLLVLPVTSRWGSSLQHSYRKHPGCGAAGGGVFQNEKCKYLLGQTIFQKRPLFPLTCRFLLRPPDVPGHSARASSLHPGQQLRGSARLDRHPDQSEPMQPQTSEHLPSLSLPQRPLALLQALSRHGSWVYAVHWVQGNLSNPLCLLCFHFSNLYPSICVCF